MKHYRKLRKQARFQRKCGFKNIREIRVNNELAIKHFDACVRLLKKAETATMGHFNLSLRDAIKRRLARIDREAKKLLEGK